MSDFEERESVTLVNDNKKIFAVFHLPKNSKGPFPAVLICPGFGGNKSGKFRIFVNLAQRLTKQGIAVLRFDYRGAGDSEGEFSELTIASQISDAELCFNYLLKDPRIDSNRIGILGRSLGGMIAVLTAKHCPRLKSIALWAPVFSSQPWRKLFETFSFTSHEALKKGMLPQLPANLPAIPSMGFLKQFFQVDLKKELNEIAHLSILHVHGEQDEFVKFDQSLEYQEACKNYQIKRFINLPSSNHDFSFEEEREVAIQETCQWFEETL